MSGWLTDRIDFRAFWRSMLSTRVPESQKLKTVGRLASLASNS